MLKRLFDIILSLTGVLFFLPFFLIISIFIVLDSRGGIFYIQKRVGKGSVDFGLFKFRTMNIGSDKKGLLTVGSNDSRITNVGIFLRKYKIDELPQLLNVLFGDMSLVGPRPEVRKYVEIYTEEQKQILKVKPGITDYASLEYFNENELLAKSNNPEETYINEILPAKIKLNEKYITNPSLATDISITLKTIKKIVG